MAAYQTTLCHNPENHNMIVIFQVFQAVSMTRISWDLALSSLVKATEVSEEQAASVFSAE